MQRTLCFFSLEGIASTFNELFELFTLRQTGIKKGISIILFDRDYWNRVINFQYLCESV